MKNAMKQAKRLAALLALRGETVATAESCTGGLIAKLITDIPGSSAVFLGGCVTYTNEIKERLLGVDPRVIAAHTEVSHACARQMARGARCRLGCDWGISTTGYAGPGGGTKRDPVGTVYIGISHGEGTVSLRFRAPEGATRNQVRAAAAAKAMEALIRLAEAGEKREATQA